MIYSRKYLQYNDFVFDSYDVIRDQDDYGVNTKLSTTEYSYGHGSYLPFKRNYFFYEETDLSLTIRLNMSKLPCEYRKFYPSYFLEEFSKPGKLWAIKNNTLVWAYAATSGITEVKNTPSDVMEFDVDFVLYEGVWHKADKQRTFIEPFNVCTFLDCKGYEEYDPCKRLGSECCTCIFPENVKEDCACCCDHLTEEMSLCYFDEKLMQEWLSAVCDTPKYHIVYDCAKGQEFFGDEYLGQRLCEKDSCSGMIAGQFYADTDIPTENVTIILNGGKMHNPYIEINGNGNYIEGDYEGVLKILPSGDVYYGDECCEKLLDPKVWKTAGNDYGWVVNPRNNRFVVDVGACCGFVCAYVQVDNLTI